MPRRILLLFLLLVPACGADPSSQRSISCSPSSQWLDRLYLAGPTRLVSSPDPSGYQAYLELMGAVQSSIRLEMFRLSDTRIESSLVAAVRKGLNAQVIVDGTSLKDPELQSTLARLRAGGVLVRPGSPAFALTHAKFLIVDDRVALISSLNLTRHLVPTRDLGLVVRDRSLVTDLVTLFDADWVAANEGTNQNQDQAPSPCLEHPNLIYSPSNAEQKLVGLVMDSLRGTFLNVAVENLGDHSLQVALERAALRGVIVRVIAPSYEHGSSPRRNLPYLRALAAAGVRCRGMPREPSVNTPYLHAKMLSAATRDGRVAYLGSANFSWSSLHRSREVGILTNQDGIPEQIDNIFERDWKRGTESVFNEHK